MWSEGVIGIPDAKDSVTCEDADKLERIIHSLISDGFTPEDTEEVERDGTVISYPMAELEIDEYDDLTDDSYRKVYEVYLEQEEEA
jgi:hypothetical protein